MRQRSSATHLRGHAETARGQVRPSNQDRVLLWQHHSCMLGMVADGVGGGPGGATASDIAVATIREHFAQSDTRSPDDYRNIDPLTLAHFAENAVRQAHQRILQAARADPSLHGMGSTLTMAIVCDAMALIAHVGDSRAYHIVYQTGEAHRLTNDHSFVGALVESGQMTPQAAERHPLRNVLFQALGQVDALEVDILQDVVLDPGDRLLLCSDGLTRHVTDSEIAYVLATRHDIRRASRLLIRLANDRGGQDNISIVVMAVDNNAQMETARLPWRTAD
jgi:PPM family protein phosphatase